MMVNFNVFTKLYPCGSEYGKKFPNMQFFFQTGGYRATANISWCDRFPPGTRTIGTRFTDSFHGCAKFYQG